MHSIRGSIDSRRRGPSWHGLRRKPELLPAQSCTYAELSSLGIPRDSLFHIKETIGLQSGDGHAGLCRTASCNRHQSATFTSNCMTWRRLTLRANVTSHLPPPASLSFLRFIAPVFPRCSAPSSRRDPMNQNHSHLRRQPAAHHRCLPAGASVEPTGRPRVRNSTLGRYLPAGGFAC